MLFINAIRIEVNTSSGLYGNEFEFTNGLNIIRGDNTSGKSSLYQAIIYCLGFEELIGGRNEKTMQSVLKDVVEYPKGQTHNVLQSFVFLEIRNHLGQFITIRRSIKSETRKPQLIDVFEGRYITDHQEGMQYKPMWVHDKGGASDVEFGFHAYLEDFLDWNLPTVHSSSGDLRKLYLQQVAPSYIIEQKRGWSGFFATAPTYGITNKEGRIVEYLLDLDVHENKKRKLELLSNKNRLEKEWEILFKKISKRAESAGGILIGISSKPIMINNTSDISIKIPTDDGDIPLSERLNQMVDELSQLNSEPVLSSGERYSDNERQLEDLKETLSNISVNQELLQREVFTIKSKIKRYEIQRISLEDDLRKNKGAKKVKNLGSEMDSKIASDHCPTCNQPIEDSLFPSEIDQTPMRIDENITYIESQIKMINSFVAGQEIELKNKEERILFYQARVTELRQSIRSIKNELLEDGRIPSVVEIERKIKLEAKINFYSSVLEDFEFDKDEILEISTAYFDIIKTEKKFTKDFFTRSDREKLTFLADSFKKLLNTFNYQSKSTDLISISLDNYLPVAQLADGDEQNKSYDLKFDSSATDFIRCIWAYTCSLFKCSLEYGCNHPLLLMFDEPKQHDLSIGDFKDFLFELGKYKEGQVFVFASFEESEESFKNSTDGVEFTYKRIEEKLIRPFKSDI